MLAAFGQHVVFQARELAKRPRFERAAARDVGFVAVGDLRDVTDTGLLEMFLECRQECTKIAKIMIYDITGSIYTAPNRPLYR